jgi:hypothetical protein
MDADNGDLAFLPLGGTGEIGMNLNLYRLGPPGKERWPTPLSSPNAATNWSGW